MDVLKTTSPTQRPSTPIAVPSKTIPFSRASTALLFKKKLLFDCSNSDAWPKKSEGEDPPALTCQEFNRPANPGPVLPSIFRCGSHFQHIVHRKKPIFFITNPFRSPQGSGGEVFSTKRLMSYFY